MQLNPTVGISNLRLMPDVNMGELENFAASVGLSNPGKSRVLRAISLIATPNPDEEQSLAYWRTKHESARSENNKRVDGSSV